MKWGLFLVLMLTAPALLFLIQVFMLMPAIFFAAGILFMIPKIVFSSSAMETLTFVGFFAAHLAVYAGVYLLLSMGIAKLLSLISKPKTRNAAFALVCVGLASVALFPVYGAGGHGQTYRGTLLYVFEEVNRDYGSFTAIIVYGSVLVFSSAVWLYRNRRRRTEPI